MRNFEIVRDERNIAFDEVVARIMARHAARQAVRGQDGEEREHQREKADFGAVEAPAHGYGSNAAEKVVAEGRSATGADRGDRAIHAATRSSGDGKSVVDSAIPRSAASSSNLG